MDKEQLIKLNNEKRKQLTEENLSYYEEMLVYIRLSYSKSEQETEEVLSELLDHLLAAQQDGKSARDVFGDEPKKYADEIIGELPNLVSNERLKYFAMIVFYFFASIAIFTGIFSVAGHYIFSVPMLTKEVFVGTFLVQTILSIPIALSFLYAIIQYLRWSCFREQNKIVEFLLFSLMVVVPFGVFFTLVYFMPEFGPVLSVPFYIVLLSGVLLYFAGRTVAKTI